MKEKKYVFDVSKNTLQKNVKLRKKKAKMFISKTLILLFLIILYIMEKNQLYLNRAKQTFFLRFTSDSLDFFDWPRTVALNDNLGAADANIKTIKKQAKFRLNF